MAMQPPHTLPMAIAGNLQGILLASMKTPTGPAWENYTEDVAKELGYHCTVEGYNRKVVFSASDVSTKRQMA